MNEMEKMRAILRLGGYQSTITGHGHTVWRSPVLTPRHSFRETTQSSGERMCLEIGAIPWYYFRESRRLASFLHAFNIA